MIKPSIACNITIVILTFKRDDILGTQASRLEQLYQSQPLFKVVIVDNNADGTCRGRFFEDKGYEFLVMRPEKNLGVAGGRNLGLSVVDTEFMVFWDDDAIVTGSFSLRLLVDLFRSDSQLGVVAFRSLNPGTGKIDAAEFPHTNKSLRESEQSFYTFRFIGVGHAMRTDILTKAGTYDVSFFYGMEEFDLAYRILNQDYKILYDPRFSLHHHKHSSGRLRSNEKWMRSYSNKLKLAFKNLPFRHVCAVASLWFFYSAFKARSLKVPFIAIQDFLVWKKLNNTKRLPIGKDALQYIKNCGGRSFV